MRIRLLFIPLLMVFILAASVYLLRWQLFGPSLEHAAENAISAVVPATYRTRVSGMGGTLFTGIRVGLVELESRRDDAVLQRLTLRDVTLSYRLSGLLPLTPLLVRPAQQTRFEWLLDDDGGLNPAAAVSRLHETLPASMRLSTDGSAVVRSENSIVRAAFRLSAGAHPEGTHLAQMRFSAIAVTDGTEDRSQTPPLTATLRSTETGVRLQVVDENTNAEILTAGVTTAPGPRSSRQFSSAQLATSLPGLEISAELGEQDGSFRVQANGSDLVDTIQRALNADARPVTGSLDARARLSRLPGAPDRPLTDRLLRDPQTVADHAAATASVGVDSLQSNPVQLSSARADLRWQRDTLQIETFEATGTATALEPWTPDGDPTVRATGSDIAWTPASGAFSAESLDVQFAGSTLRVRGAGTVAGTGEALTESTGSVRGRLQLKPDAILRGVTGADPGSALVSFSEEATAEVSFTLSATGAGPQLTWDLSAAGLQTGNLPPAEVQARGVALLGSVRVDEFNAETIPVEGERSTTAALESPVTVAWSAEGFSVSETIVVSGKAEVRAHASVISGSVEGSLEVTGLPVSALTRALGSPLGGAVRGALNAEVAMEGPLEAPDATLSVSTTDLALDGVPGAVSILAAQRDSALHLRTLAVDLGERVSASGTGSAPVTVGAGGARWGNLEALELSLTATAQIARLMPSGAGAAWDDAVATLELSADGMDGTAALRVTGLDGGSEQVVVGIEPVESVALRAEGVPTGNGAGRLSGTLSADGDEFAGFSATVDPASAADEPSLRFSSEFDVPLARFSHLIPGVVASGGAVIGDLTGTERLNDLVGSIRISRGIVKLSDGVPVLSSVRARLSVSDGEVIVERARARLGDSPVRVSGRIGLEDADGMDLDLEMKGSNLLLFRSPDLIVRADVDGEVTSSTKTTVVSGTVSVRRVAYERPVELFSLGTDAASPTPDVELFSVDQPWARSVTLDVRVLADQSIEIQNNLYSGTLSADLILGGTAAVARAEGIIFGTDGAVRLPTTTLDMNRIRVRFPEENAFQPLVEGEAQTQLQGYDMSITLDGQIPNIEVSVLSSPPLPTDQALILLSTGRRLSDLQFSNGVAAGAAGLLGRGVLRQLSKTADGEAADVFDRLDFAIERDTEEQRIGNIAVEYRLVEDRSWFLEFERTRNDEYTVELQWQLWGQ